MPFFPCQHFYDPLTFRHAVEDNSQKRKTMQRSYGFRMSILGQISTQAGSVVLLVVVVILSETLTGAAANSA